MGLLSSGTSVSYFGVNIWDFGRSEERYGRLVSTATWNIVCQWIDRYFLLSQMGGVSPLGTIVVPPAIYPENSSLFLRDSRVRPWYDDTGLSTAGSLSGLGAPKFAAIELFFASPSYDPSILNSLRIDYGTEMYRFPVTTPSFKYTDGTPVQPGDMKTFHKGVATLLIEQKNMPILDIGLLESLAGTSNAANFYGAPIEKVAYGGFCAQRRVITNAKFTFDFIHTFKYDSKGWNTAFNPTTGTWDAITTIVGGDKPYPSADYSRFVSSSPYTS